jgi:hypothetical protein
MRCISAVILLGLSLQGVALGQLSNGVTVLTYSSRRQDFEWRVSERRLRADLKWDPTKREAPLQPGKAFRIAAAWLRKRQPNPELASIQIESLAVRDATLAGHYIYVIEFATGAFDTMAVVVLMDGTVIEPTPLARKRDPTNEGGAR